MVNKTEKLLKVEYWPHAIIIVNGIVASNFYRANMIANNNTNKR